MFLIRCSAYPLPPGYEPGAHWQVEFHADSGELPFPLGTAYVTAFPDVAWIDLIHVVDSFRQQGVGTALGLACLQRWPGILINEQAARINPSFSARLRRLKAGNQQWCGRLGCESWRFPEWR